MLSLIAGIASVLGGVCLVLPPFVAIIAGHWATPSTRSGQRGGHGMAIAGLIMGYLTGLPLLGWMVLFIIGAAGSAGS